MARERGNKHDEKTRISYVLYMIYIGMLVIGIGLGVHFLCIKLFWKPDEEIAARLTQPVRKNIIEPNRGKILAMDGRPLALSYPRYQIYIDPNARIDEFNKLSTLDRQDSIKAWKEKAAVFAQGLSKVNGGKPSAAQFKDDLYSAFDKKRRYLKLGKPIEKEQYELLKSYPLANEPRHKGGVWAEQVPTRRYPYGALARRTIGSTIENEEMSSYSGIDGKYNFRLKGSEGKYYTRKTDNGFIRDYDSTYVEAVDGMDVRTTLNIDYQEIADRILRSYVDPEQDLEAACFVLMDVKTGAVRTMVNLERNGKDKNGEFGENVNVAVTYLGEPGSVFKTTTLMTCIEDGIINSIDDTVPCNNGLVPGFSPKIYPADKHLKDYARIFGTEDIPIWFCTKVSSNNAFRRLAYENFKDKPEEFTNRLFSYNLGQPFEFDTFEEITKPNITTPSSNNWNPITLGQIAIGYGASVTPMHLIMFYNAIAAGGKMMKPYLVEDIEKDGRIIEKFGPSILNSNICSERTADIVTQALCKVTENNTVRELRGTAWRLSYIADKCKVAGKTGTADIFTDGKYVHNGARKQQGTFVGFFPAEDPQYSVICVVYSKLSKKEFAGGVIPVSVVRDFIKEIYNIDPYWNETLATD